MEEVYLITYKDQNTIEGFILNKFDFKKWLSRHNEQRKKEGSILEHKNEFKIKKIQKLI